MTQAEIISIIVGATGCTKTVAESTYKAVINTLIGRVKTNGNATLPGLGSFKVVEHQARVGRNPRTGDPVQVPAKKVVRLVAGKVLKELVNP